MIELTQPFRAARADDAPALAELVNFAGEDLPLYLWDKLAEPGQTPWDVGQSRAAREAGSFSYSNAVVAELDGRIAACLIGYPQPESPEPVDTAAMPPMFVPLQELENLAPGSWYVNVLAAYPEHRGRGFGAGLLSIAEQLARAAGSMQMSLIVSDANHGAARLYARCGYREGGRRPMVKENWENEGENWILLVKALSA